MNPRKMLQKNLNKPKQAKQEARLPLSRIVKTSYHGLKSLPQDLSSDTLQVFKLLSKCFAISNNIREAPLVEVIKGFEQVGYSPGFVMAGLRGLHESGYIALTDEWCNVLDLSTVNDTGKVWYMLTDKWLDLLSPPEAPGFSPDVYAETVRIS